jgi:uncharacterized phage-associated protein
MINIKQEKLINAILYFVKNTRNCRKMKLFKLLYFLDFIHFKYYGTTVTGMEYYAWKLGPVPEKLYNKFSKADSKNNFKDFFKVIKETDSDDKGNYSFKIIPKAKPDLTVFTPKEKKILEDVAFQFKEASATEMSEITHLKNTPWSKTPRGKLIDYNLALDSCTTLTKDEAIERYEIEKQLNNFME